MSPRWWVRAGLVVGTVLVVLALLLFGAGLLLPVVLHARQQNDRRLCENNLKQLGLSIHNVNDVYKKIPPVVGSFPTPQQYRATLFFHILPFIEHDNLYRQAIQNLDDPETYATVIPTYLNPADKSAPPNNRHRSFATNPGAFLIAQGFNLPLDRVQLIDPAYPLIGGGLAFANAVG